MGKAEEKGGNEKEERDKNRCERRREVKERCRCMLPNKNDHTLDINCSSSFCWSSSSGFLSNCVRSLPTNWTSYSSWGDPSGLGRWAYCSTLLGYDGVMWFLASSDFIWIKLLLNCFSPEPNGPWNVFWAQNLWNVWAVLLHYTLDYYRNICLTFAEGEGWSSLID